MNLVVAGLGLCFVVALRWVISFHSYSGASKPPMYGDFEAQRHWMEITYNLPINDWYRNTSDNDLLYWGLDYPPLTAYHSWLCGFVQSRINKTWVKLGSSRGLEEPSHKLFMRYSVLLVDVLIFMPALFCCFIFCKQPSSNLHALFFSSFLMLTYPGLILIDHGHFQYNCVSLGLLLWAVVFVGKSGAEMAGSKVERVSFLSTHSMDGDNKDHRPARGTRGVNEGKDGGLGAAEKAIISLSNRSLVCSSIFFCLSLNYKQMQLYHSLPFFFFFLGNITFSNSSLFNKLKALCFVAVAVAGTFVVCWLPFLSSLESFLHVLNRLFPFNRGLFEDKVSNFWCSISVLVKFKDTLTPSALLKLCSLTTLASVSPSCISLFMRPTFNQFILSLFNASMAFFLFSFQVHEKSILLAAVPMNLLYTQHPLEAVWFLIASTFSMLPLFIKDGLVTPCLSCCVFFYVLSTFKHHFSLQGADRRSAFMGQLNRYLFPASLGTMVVLSLVLLYIPPPSHLPDMHTLLVTSFSCAQFLYFLSYFTALQIIDVYSAFKTHHAKTE